MLWMRVKEMVNYSGVFFGVALCLVVTTAVWVYIDSHRYWHSEKRAFMLSLTSALFLLSLFFIHPFYLIAFMSGLGLYIVFGHRLPYATYKCSDCGSANWVLAHNCSQCGKVICAITGQSKICPECQQAYPGAARYCSSCGMSLAEYEYELPGPRKDGAVMNCSSCGEKNMNWRNECWKCGHKLDFSVHQPSNPR